MLVSYKALALLFWAGEWPGVFLEPEGDRVLYGPGDRRCEGGIAVVSGLGRSQPPVPVDDLRARCAGSQRCASEPVLFLDDGPD